ncbi:S-adenosyl-L-methionine-dependent methyltransferase [Madurella fahalii]|uniref:S-adenosyl-L-methionine-dependent methyltransferase n=1 Tax=Madurella fahalii TaxID=1157608 RepID=A0ABQ0GPP4_9PEZI
MSTQESLSAQSLASWQAIASYWDATISKTGNKYWHRLQEPSLTRLLSAHLSKPGCRVLDLATGNGLCARWLMQNGAVHVLATDGCEEMVQIARSYAQADGTLVENGGRAEFRVADVTSERDLQGLVGSPEDKYDVVLMNMAIMDVPTLEPLAKALPGLLAKDGVFVATLLHPVFFTSGASRNVELQPNPVTGELEVVRTKIIKDYMYVPPAMGIAVAGQPVKQVYYHRPMHELFTTFFRSGLVMDAMEELAFTEEDAEARIESSSNYTQLPAILAFRMRLL